MENERLKYLIDVHRNGLATPEERRELDVWYADFDGDPGITTQLSKDQLDDKERFLLGRINTRIDGGRELWRRLVAAAVVLVLLTVSVYTYFGGAGDRDQTEDAQVATHDIPPGKNTAVLTLGDGSTIELDNLADGSSLQEQGVSIVKNEDGLLTYRVGDGAAVQEVSLNTISTPRGGQYRVALPDGTLVRLNAASSITYPTQFKGTDRR